MRTRAQNSSMGLAGRSAQKTLGAFNTPDKLAEWVAKELLGAAASANAPIRNVIDPACGNGALLSAIRRVADTPINLTGIDIDRSAAARSWTTVEPPSDIRVGDALDPRIPWGDRLMDAVIVNPPWGGELQRSRQFYQDNGYQLASGQFDISDLFVERALSVMRPGTYLGLILPDAIFQADHRALREMLLKHTLLLVARLGEGIFKDVYRGAVVIVLRHGTPDLNHLVECLQLPAFQRKRLQQGLMSFEDAKAEYSHRTPQSRFANNPGYMFNIMQAQHGYDVFKKFSAIPAFNWTKRAHIGRGIEIGKRGLTIHCEMCGNYRAAPANDRIARCIFCGEQIPQDAPLEAIVVDAPRGPEWHPLITGEDMDRYSANWRRYIRMGVPGIKYKPMEHFARKKLLIRKTGVGLRAAIDESGAATTQSVFYVVTKSRGDGWLLDYLQGIINSRPMLAWYLQWSGENQWRSHPYLTLSGLKGLPIPDPNVDARTMDLARNVAVHSRRARTGSMKSEQAIDEIVFRLYGLNRDGAAWVSDVLNSADGNLKYFLHMKSGPQRGFGMSELPAGAV